MLGSAGFDTASGKVRDRKDMRCPMKDKHGQAHEHDEHCGHHHGHDHGDGEHVHGLVPVTIELEDEHIPALDEVAAELTRDLKQPWDRGAVVRLALSEFFSRRGMIT
jgi:hypothetical protein